MVNGPSTGIDRHCIDAMPACRAKNESTRQRQSFFPSREPRFLSYGSELSPYFGDESQQPLATEASARPPGVRSLASETLWEYGARAGGWRLLRLLQQESVKATFYVCGMALEQNPPFAGASTEQGHEVFGHGYRWVAQWGMEREAEQAYIRQAVYMLEE